MKVLIAGSRDYPLEINFDAAMIQFCEMWGMPDEVVCGDCYGPDKKGEAWANERGIHVEHFPANWDKYKNAAGPIRNREMAEYLDRAIIFWDAKSKGTKNMIEECKRANKPYTVIYPSTKII